MIKIILQITLLSFLRIDFDDKIRDKLVTMFNPKVSIIILSYNQDKFLKNSIDSVINQTYKNLEIIISDNGSTDNSKSIIEEYNIGTKTITELIDTESDLLSIYVSYFDSKKNFIQNYFKIKALEGKLVESFQNYLPKFE